MQLNYLQNKTRTNRRRKCPPGYIHRRGYTRKNTGTYVKGSCIRSTSPYLNNLKKLEASRKKKMEMRLSHQRIKTRKRCPKGQIPRSAYVRRFSRNIASRGYTKRVRSGKIVRIIPKQKSIYVESTCVKDVGKPGKLPVGSPKIGPLRKGELLKHGYSYKLPESVRRSALEKAIKEFGPLDTYRKLNAVSKLTTLSSPTASSVFSSDRNWIRSKYSVGGELKAF